MVLEYTGDGFVGEGGLEVDREGVGELVRGGSSFWKNCGGVRSGNRRQNLPKPEIPNSLSLHFFLEIILQIIHYFK